MVRMVMLIGCILISLGSVQIPAQQPPQLAVSEPGEVFITPKINLGLVPTPLVVPEQFKNQLPEDRSVLLPPGFSAKVFAVSNLEGPRLMAWSPDGVLHIANMKAGGGGQFTPAVNRSTPPSEENMLAQVLAFPDRDRDGVADTVIVVADHLWFPNSIDFYQGDLYVADMHQVVRLRDTDGDKVFEERQVIIADLPVGHHRTRTLLFDKLNDKLYLSIGSSCDLCREDDSRRATILSFDPDGTKQSIFARGLRNAVGMAFHPLTNELWVTVNGHDREGNFLPPERIDIIREGGFYGWPIAFGYQSYVDFSISDYKNAIFPLTAQDSLDVLQVPRPVAQVPAHMAPMGIHFYTAEAFPDQYKNVGFVALRGRGRDTEQGYKVVALFSEPDGSGMQVGDFLGSLLDNPDDINSVWGKPVGITNDAQGHLYVTSDWITHVVIRISHVPLKGSIEEALPATIFTNSPLQLNTLLKLSGLDPDGEAPEVSVDLSQVGGPANWPLIPQGDNRYRLNVNIETEIPNGDQEIIFNITQQTLTDKLHVSIVQRLQALPGMDLVIVDDKWRDGWTSASDKEVEILAPDTSGPVFSGTSAVPIQILNPPILGWNLTLQPPRPLDSFGYSAVRFAFHPGDATPGLLARFNILLEPGGRIIDLLGDELIDLDKAEWQIVEIPMSRFVVEQAIESILLAGTLGGTFYLDDMRWVTATPHTNTAVVETRIQGSPEAFALQQNYPNPFNSSTTIAFTVPATTVGEHVQLTLFNLSGQQLVDLVDGWRVAGEYSLQWDGKTTSGIEVATGVYFYRLRIGDRVAIRKLMLMR